MNILPNKSVSSGGSLEKTLGGYRKLHGLIVAYAKPHWKLLLLLVALNLLVILATNALIVMTGATLNAFTLPSEQLHQNPGPGALNLTQMGNWAYQLVNFANLKDRFEIILALASGALLIGILKSFLTYTATVAGSWTAACMARDLQQDLLGHVLGFSMGFFHRHRTGELMSRINGDTSSAMQDFANIVNILLVNPILLGIYIYMVIQTSWTLLMGIVLAGVANHVISILLNQPIRRNANRLTDIAAHISHILQEALTNIRVVKTFAAESVELNRFRERMQRLRNETFHGSMLRNAESPARLVVTQVVQFVIVIVAAYEFSHGRISLSTCLFFIFICGRIVDPINQLSTAYVMSGKMLATLSRVFNLLHEQPDLVDGPLPVRHFTTSLHIDKAVFAYQEKNVIHGIDLEIRKGEMLALVGPSGGGKSTLTDLIMRFYDPQGGRVLLDGTDVRQLKIAEYRRLFGVVSQEPLLFNASIRDNILYGRPHLTEDDMLRAARVAHADHFIEAMPEKYDTFVGDRGIRLSGGQRQRIAIARAVSGRPEILLLDEATSALDSESEREVQQAITEISKLATSIVIAHRLSTVLHADRIAFIQNGTILQIGKHQELLETCERYRRLCEMQFRANAASAPEAA